MSLIETVNSPADLKKLPVEELPVYAEDARNFIIDTVFKNGGHLSSNLGSVELTIALHYVFNSPRDKIVWDVGHQAYTHKLITGRREGLVNLRKNGGASGFPNVSESGHDSFTVGHSSTSLSSALGLARARDLNGENNCVIAVIGDGALTGGMAYEALNDIGSAKTKLLIVLNDNRMSISKNVGAMARYLSRIRMSRSYAGFKSVVKKGVTALPFFGDKLYSLLEKAKNTLKSVFVKDKMFEQMGIRYYGPIDGHNIKTLIRAFENVKDDSVPVLIHIRTQKGRGHGEAEKSPERFHGVPPPQSEGGESMSKAAGETLAALADSDDKITAVTAAMCDGTGLLPFCERHRDRFFDVGIAEQHAVTMCAALAKGGFKPYFAVYSSFLQRGFDQIIHDVAIMNLPVRFLIDRAGVIGADGVTHQGVFDIAYLNMIPNLTVLTPSDAQELVRAVRFSQNFPSPLAIRYPKCVDSAPFKTVNAAPCGEPRESSEGGAETGELSGADEDTPLRDFLKWRTVRKGKRVCILASGGRMLGLALGTASAEVVDVSCVKPLDTVFLRSAGERFDLIVTMEDGVLKGGFGDSVLSFLNGEGLKPGLVSLGIRDAFVTNTDLNEVMDGIKAELDGVLNAK